MSISIMSIDTQQMVNVLTAAGIPQVHAGAIASVIATTTERHHAFTTETLCSKSDLDHAIAPLHAAIEGLKMRMDALKKTMATKADLANVEKRITLRVVRVIVLAQLLPDLLQRLSIA